MTYVNVYLAGLVVLTAISVYGILSSRNWVKILMCLEVLGLSLIFIASLLSLSLNSISNIGAAQTYLVVLVAVDSGILGVLIAVIYVLFKKIGRIEIDKLSELKG